MSKQEIESYISNKIPHLILSLGEFPSYELFQSQPILGQFYIMSLLIGKGFGYFSRSFRA